MSAIDKATPRPWKLDKHVIRDVKERIVCQPWMYNQTGGLNSDETEANEQLIVKAVNLFEAHEAVAEAAKQHGMNCNCSPKDRLSGHRSGCFVPALEASLENLAALRKKEGV